MSRDVYRRPDISRLVATADRTATTSLRWSPDILFVPITMPPGANPVITWDARYIYCSSTTYVTLAYTYLYEVPISGCLNVRVYFGPSAGVGNAHVRLMRGTTQLFEWSHDSMGGKTTSLQGFSCSSTEGVYFQSMVDDGVTGAYILGPIFLSSRPYY